MLEGKREELLALPRWGEKKVNNLVNNVEEAKNKATLAKTIFALAIPNVGDTICKQLAKKYQTMDNICSLTREDFVRDGFTQSVSTQLGAFLDNKDNRKLLMKLKQVGLIQ